MNHLFDGIHVIGAMMMWSDADVWRPKINCVGCITYVWAYNDTKHVDY